MKKKKKQNRNETEKCMTYLTTHLVSAFSLGRREGENFHAASQISGEQGMTREHEGAYIGLERTDTSGNETSRMTTNMAQLRCGILAL